MVTFFRIKVNFTSFQERAEMSWLASLSTGFCLPSWNNSSLGTYHK